MARALEEIFFFLTRFIGAGYCPITPSMVGRTRLPKFKFSANFPISPRFTLDFTNTDKKVLKCIISYMKKTNNRKSIEIQPWTPLEVILNEFCIWITVRCMQRSRKWIEFGSTYLLWHHPLSQVHIGYWPHITVFFFFVFVFCFLFLFSVFNWPQGPTWEPMLRRSRQPCSSLNHLQSPIHFHQAPHKYLYMKWLLEYWSNINIEMWRNYYFLWVITPIKKINDKNQNQCHLYTVIV